MNAERNKAEGVRRREAKAKHMEALGEIYRRYVRRVFGLCRSMFEQRLELRAVILSKLV
jgi:hypothetical protein